MGEIKAKSSISFYRDICWYHIAEYEWDSSKAVYLSYVMSKWRQVRSVSRGEGGGGGCEREIKKPVYLPTSAGYVRCVLWFVLYLIRT